MGAGALGNRPEYLKQVKRKVANYCAFRERCTSEVRDKLESYECQPDEIEELLMFLETEGFLDDQRFTQAYAKDKFRQNKWGKIKIRQYLKQKQVPSDLIEDGLASIPEEEYTSTLEHLVERKYQSVKGENDYIKSNKTAQSMVGKGYESDLVWTTIKLLSDK
ncbi:MAG: regulatory protein RecX [Cyclobacteriaceae bacterium]